MKFVTWAAVSQTESSSRPSISGGVTVRSMTAVGRPRRAGANPPPPRPPGGRGAVVPGRRGPAGGPAAEGERAADGPLGPSLARGGGNCGDDGRGQRPRPGPDSRWEPVRRGPDPRWGPVRHGPVRNEPVRGEPVRGGPSTWGGPDARTRREPCREHRGDLVLDFEDVGYPAVDPSAELDRAGLDVHDPGGDAQGVSQPLQGAVDHPDDALSVIGVEDACAVGGVRGAAVADTLRRDGEVSDDLQSGVLQIDGDRLGDARADPVIGGLPAHVRERRDHHRGRRLSNRGGRRGDERRPGEDHRGHPHPQADRREPRPRQVRSESMSRRARCHVVHAIVQPEIAAFGLRLFVQPTCRSPLRRHRAVP